MHIGHSGYWSCERCIQKGKSCQLPRPKGSVKTGSTIQFTDLNAPLRLDEDFLLYMVSDDCEDEHLLGLNDLSPFIDIGFPMVSGFNLDPMHLMFAGCFKRRLKGLVSVTTEGKMKGSDLASADARLKLFQRCKPAEFDRYVRPLSSCVDKYKMHELRDFLMCYLFPVFHGILTDDQLHDIMLLQYVCYVIIGGFRSKSCP